MFKPAKIGSVAPEQAIQSRQTLWKDQLSVGVAVTLPNALVISVSGRLTYQHFVEICFFAVKRWRPNQQHLVLDFSKMKFGDGTGVKYIANQLHAAACQNGGHVYFVRIPPTAKAFLDRTWGSENVHFVQSLNSVVSKLPATGIGAVASTEHTALPKLTRLNRRRSRRRQIKKLASPNPDRPIIR